MSLRFNASKVTLSELAGGEYLRRSLLSLDGSPLFHQITLTDNGVLQEVRKLQFIGEGIPSLLIFPQGLSAVCLEIFPRGSFSYRAIDFCYPGLARQLREGSERTLGFPSSTYRKSSMKGFTSPIGAERIPVYIPSTSSTAWPDTSWNLDFTRDAPLCILEVGLLEDWDLIRRY